MLKVRNHIDNVSCFMTSELKEKTVVLLYINMTKVIIVKNEQQKQKQNTRYLLILGFKLYFLMSFSIMNGLISFYFQILFGTLCYFYSFSGVFSSSLIT